MSRSLFTIKNSLFSLLISLAAVASAMRIVALAQNSPILLKGGVEHSETLPALPPQLQPGAVFERGTLGEAPKSEGWRRLPNCMAGGWEERDYTLDKSQNFMTGAIVSTPKIIHKYQNFTRGYQMDSAGDIWDYPPARAKQTAETATTTTNIVVRNREVLELSSDRLVERSTSLQIDVGVNNHLIERVTQVEQIVKRQCIQSGLVSYSASVKTYSGQGKPMTQYQQHGTERRVRDFARIGTLNGQDLRSSFNNYLVSHGLANLVPTKF